MTLLSALRATKVLGLAVALVAGGMTAAEARDGWGTRHHDHHHRSKWLPSLELPGHGERFETVMTDRDVISVPPGVYREEINIGDEDALMCVMLGAKKPITPTYPADHPLAKIKR